MITVLTAAEFKLEILAYYAELCLEDFEIR